MAWTDMPPASGQQFQFYPWITQLWQALRERSAVIGATPVPGFEWPPSTHIWQSGRIASIEVDPDDDTKLRVHCLVQDPDTLDYVTADNDFSGAGWVDFAGHKRWYNCDEFDLNGSGAIEIAETDDPDDGVFVWTPPFYKIVIYPIAADGASTATRLSTSDPNRGFIYEIRNNGDDYATIDNDGQLELNDGRALGDYTWNADDGGFAFQIIRSGGGEFAQQGFGWTQRFPPQSNDDEFDFGAGGAVRRLTPPGSGTYVLTFNGNATPALAHTASADDVRAAVEALVPAWLDQIAVDVDGGDLLIVFGVTITSSSTSAGTLTTPTDVIGDITKNWSTDEWAGVDPMEATFQVDDHWYRASITANSPHTLTLSGTPGGAITGNYWIINEDAWWRPAYGVHLASVVSRTGQMIRVRDANAPWSPTAWYYGAASDVVTYSVRPTDDTIQRYLIPAETVLRGTSAAPGGDCDPDVIKTFDISYAGTDFVDYCGNEDLMFNPTFFHALRGLQVGVEEMMGSFIPPVAPDEQPRHISNFTHATWFEFFAPDDSREAVISDIGEVGHYGPDTDPDTGDPIFHHDYYYPIVSWSVPVQGMDVYWALLETDTREVVDAGVESSTRVIYGSAYDDRLISDRLWSEDDVGRTLVISFGWRRHFPREFRYLYPRTFFIPDTVSDPGEIAAVPPPEYAPGIYQTNEASTTFCEFDKLGHLLDTGETFPDGVAARYHADAWDDPVEIGGDAAIRDWWLSSYQGRAAHPSVSTLPRWEGGARNGTATDGGSFWLEDTGQLWWVSSSTLIEHTGTATGGSMTTLQDSSLYQSWSNGDASPGPETFTTRTSNFWTGVNAQRFVGMILEVEVSTGVWERRPITAQTLVGTGSHTPQVTVAPAFSVSTNGKTYKIREPGYGDSGAILNLWRGKKLKVTKPDGTEGTCVISYSDDTRLYFDADALGFDVAAGDTYQIIQIEPGAVLHRKPSDTDNAINGWVLPEHADADTRGEDWHVGRNGPFENMPFVKQTWGRLRKGDYVTLSLFQQIYKSIDCLRWTATSMSWSSRLDPDVPEDNYKEAQYSAGDPTDSGDSTLAKSGAETAWGSATPTEMSGAPFATASTSADLAFDAWISSAARQYAYAVATVIAPMQRTIEVWGYCEIDGSLRDDGDVILSGGPPATNSDEVHFDDDGDGGAFREWASVASLGPGLQTEVRELVGDDALSIPSWPPDPPACTGDFVSTSSRSGYKITDQRAVIKWDVTGGLVYVS